MKRILIILIIAISQLFAGCRDDRIDLPDVKATPAQITLTSDITTAQISLSAVPPLNIHWELSYKPDWLDISPASGNIDGTGPITVTALIATLLPQILKDKIVFNTTAGDVEVPVSLHITRSAAIQLTPSPLLFEYDENAKTISIKNNSNQAVNWQLEPSAGYMAITPASGTLNASQSADVTLSVNRNTLETRSYSETLNLKLGGVANSSIPVSINNFKEDKWILDGAVTDAEYDRKGDNLFVLTGNKLSRLKPETKSAVSVVLSLPGNCVSVGPDGRYAVVGHDALISLVNLTTMKVDKTFPVSTEALDVILAPNNWAYVFPKGDQWQNIRCINLLDGMEVFNSGRQIYAGTKAKLHPSGNYIYGVNNGLSPSDAEKYDIRDGQAAFLYDSPYHGDYEFGGDLWMSDDGLKMFTRGRNVFRLSTTQNTDMIYADQLAGTGVGVKTLDQITAKNRVYAVYFDIYTQLPQNEIKIFTGDFLGFLGTKPIPGFLVKQGSTFQIVPSEGVYGFFNASGTKYFLCIRSNEVSGSPVQWAVAIINVD